jgi:hypothetical protein
MTFVEFVLLPFIAVVLFWPLVISIIKNPKPPGGGLTAR